MSEIKVYAYQLRTPIHEVTEKGSDIFHKSYFDFTIANEVFKYIVSLNDEKRMKTYKDCKTMKLTHYNDNYNDNFAYGKFVTVSHGEVGRNVDVTANFKTTSTYHKNEGREKQVQFIIDKRSGYIYIEKDRSAVINRSLLNNYLSTKFDGINFKKVFNSKNGENYLISSKRVIQIEMLEPIPFIEQLKQIEVLKSVTVKMEKERISKEDEGAISDLKSHALDNNLGEFNATVELAHFDKTRLSEEMLNFIRYLIDSGDYEGVKVKGKTADEVIRTFTPDKFTRNIIINCETDVEGNANDTEFFMHLEHIIDRDTHLRVEHVKLSNILYVEVESMYHGESETD